ncbi:MAG: HlyD family efflux transporter periplasmic adaptor subunit [Deltaproteobacteria bacterium]|nr:HlyD family efflux transporter periplasmic adaptor subunit [Deltaproteobacteria bacterium]
MKKKKLLPLIPLVLIAGFLLYRSLGGEKITPGAVLVSGNIEVIQVELGFKIPGRLSERPASEGASIAKGDVVALLDDSDLQQDLAAQSASLKLAQAALAELTAGTRPEEIARARAAVKRSEAALADLEAGSRPQEIAAARARVDQAQAAETYAKKEHDRVKSLAESRIVAQRDYDQAKSAWVQAEEALNVARQSLKLAQEGARKDQVGQARAAVSETREGLRLAENGPRKETIAQASARVEQAEAAVALSKTRLSYATLLSPLSGVILSENAEPGEYLSAGTPVVTVAGLEKVYLRAYIAETDLGRVKVGQKVKVTADTYPGKVYQGRISFIASEAEFTPKNVQTQKERVKLVYRVKITLDNPKMELKPGMPADAEILTGKEE